MPAKEVSNYMGNAEETYVCPFFKKLITQI